MEFTPRDPATVKRPPPGKYRLFMDEAGNFVRMDSAGQVSTMAFSADVTGEVALPTNIVRKRFLSGLVDGSTIGPNCNFSKIASAEIVGALISGSTLADDCSYGIIAGATLGAGIGFTDPAAFLAALGFTVSGSGSSGAAQLGTGGLTVTWRDHAFTGGITTTYAYGDSYTYSSWARALATGDDGSGDVGTAVMGSGTSSATVRINGGTTYGTLFAIGI